MSRRKSSARQTWNAVVWPFRLPGVLFPNLHPMMSHWDEYEILDYGFSVLALSKVEAHTYANNIRARKALGEAGF